MSLTLIHNNMHILRRFVIGIVLGLCVVFAASVMNKESSSSIPPLSDQTEFDRETVALQNTDMSEKESDADSLSSLNSDDEGATRYSFFARNKSPLTKAQIDAINNGTPILSLVVTHVGQQSKMVDHIIKTLPADVTLGVSPHLSSSSAEASRLWDFGYELWMVMAAITLEINHDHGDYALTPTNNFEYNMGLIDDQINEKPYFAGLILPAQALIKRSGKLWEDIVYDIFGQGYGLLDNTDGILKPSLYFYDDHRAPYLESDRVLTDMPDLDSFRDILNNARQSALTDKRYILSVRAETPAHLDILAEWLNSLPSDGITLVPLSAQAKL